MRLAPIRRDRAHLRHRSRGARRARVRASRLRAKALGSLAEMVVTGEGGAAASIASARPSTNAMGPPWVAVWVARTCRVVRARRAAAQVGARVAGPDGGSGRTQARRPSLRSRRMKPIRSRRGLVRPVRSNSPGCGWW